MDLPADEAFALQFAQCLRQHALRDVEDGTAQLTEAMRALSQSEDEKRAPFVAYPVEHVPNRAVVRQAILLPVGLQTRCDPVPGLSGLARLLGTRFHWFLQGNYLPK